MDTALKVLFAIILLPLAMMVLVSVVDWWRDFLRICVGKDPVKRYPDHYTD